MPQITDPFISSYLRPIVSSNIAARRSRRDGAAAPSTDGGDLSDGALRLEAAADRVAGELDAVAHAELVENILAVPFDCLAADHELDRGDVPAPAVPGGASARAHPPVARRTRIRRVGVRTETRVGAANDRAPPSPSR